MQKVFPSKNSGASKNITVKQVFPSKNEHPEAEWKSIIVREEKNYSKVFSLPYFTFPYLL